MGGLGDPIIASQLAEVEGQIAAAETELDALIARGRTEVEEVRAVEAGAAAAAEATKTEAALGRLRELKEELEGLGTTEEKIAAVRMQLSDTISELGALRSEASAGAVDEAIATAEEIARRQIEALEKPARDAAERAAEQTRETIGDLSTSIAQFGDARAQFVARALAKLGEGATPEERAEAERLANELYDLEEAQRAATAASRGTAKASREANDAMSEGERITRAMMTATEEYAATLSDLNRLLEAGAIGQETYARAVAEAERELAAAQAAEREAALATSDDPFEGARAGMEEYAEETLSTAEMVKGSIVDAFSAAEDAVGDFVRTSKLEVGSLVSSIIADMAQLAIRQRVLTPLANWLGNLGGGGAGAGAAAPASTDGGFLGSLLGSLGGGGGGGFFGWLGNFVGGGRASGGPVAAGMAYVVGERAPELFVPDRSGRILPMETAAILRRRDPMPGRDPARGSGSGGGVVQVNITTPDIQSFRQSRTQVAADIARAVNLGRRGL